MVVIIHLLSTMDIPVGSKNRDKQREVSYSCSTVFLGWYMMILIYLHIALLPCFMSNILYVLCMNMCAYMYIYINTFQYLYIYSIHPIHYSFLIHTIHFSNANQIRQWTLAIHPEILLAVLSKAPRFYGDVRALTAGFWRGSGCSILIDKLPSLKLTARPWESNLVGRWINCLLGARPIFRGKLLVSGSVNIWLLNMNISPLLEGKSLPNKTKNIDMIWLGVPCLSIS